MSEVTAHKRTVVRAWRFDGANVEDIVAWADGAAMKTPNGDLLVMTDHGDLVAEPGDWVLRNETGEHYPVKASVFKATYDVVGE